MKVISLLENGEKISRRDNSINPSFYDKNCKFICTKVTKPMTIYYVRKEKIC